MQINQKRIRKFHLGGIWNIHPSNLVGPNLGQSQPSTPLNLGSLVIDGFFTSIETLETFNEVINLDGLFVSIITMET